MSSGKFQLYSLAVPTEKEGLTTIEDRDDRPERVRDRLVRTAPAGWTQQVQQTGSGDSAVITKVTWTGGKTPTGEDSLFQFLAQPASAKTYTFQVQQTYSDGSIVNWSGPESSDSPAPTIEAKSSLGGGGSSVAVDHRADRRRARPARRRVRARQPRRGGGSWHERAGADRRRARGAASRCGRGAERRVGARVPDQDRARGERRARRSAPERPADLRRGGRAAVRDHLGHRTSPGQQVTTGPVHRSPANPDTLVVPLRPHLPQGWYLIYWRAISVDGHPVQGAFTYAVGPNPGPAPQFPIPSIAGTATTPQLLIARWVMFLSVMSAIGLFVFRVLIARPQLGAFTARACERSRSRS